MTRVGIDSAAFYSSHYFLDLKTLAAARGVDIDKFYVGLGQRKMAVSPPDEGVVTLAANAAHELLKDIDVSEIDTLMFATESGVDHSKATGIYVHNLLQLPANCRVIELKQACYSATFGLQTAMAMLRDNPKRKILLIAADIARYGLNTPGESSQGGGACAMLLTANPRLFSIDPECGFYTEDVMDFWRPNYRQEALVDGKYSIEVYLKGLSKAWEHYQRHSKHLYQDFDKFLFHIPIPRLAEKAYQKLAILNGERKPNAQAISDALDDSLRYAREIGNCYTASLYIGLISLLENCPEDLKNKRIGLYSYGSGCVAEFFSGTVQPDYQTVLHRDFHQALLSQRQELTQEEYERFYTFAYPTDGSHVDLPQHNTGHYRLAQLSEHKPLYQPAQKPGVAAKAPAKLILSGEHAILQGCPALATAVDYYTTTTVSKRSLPGVLFEMTNLPHKGELTRDALKQLKFKVQEKYQRFRNGEIGIRNVLKKPFELIEYTAGYALDQFKSGQSNEGYRIHTQSDIPTGCGLGSSAASIVSTNFALSQLLGKAPTETELHQLNIHAENLQHGQSSGIDVLLSSEGGCRFFHQGTNALRRPWHKTLTLLNTGKPLSTTGECVQHSKSIFAKRPALAQAFTQVTQTMDQAWQNQDEILLKEAIKSNHRLLVEIGVVPTKIQTLIDAIESHGGAAKICGAGAVTGENAGVVWVEGIDDGLLKTFGYPILKVHSTETGVTLI